MKNQIIYVCMISAAIILSGCGGKAITKNQYLIDVAQKCEAKSTVPVRGTLDVREFSIDSEFSGRQMVYRVDEFRYVPDYYNEFFISPASMMTQAVRNCLMDAQIFSRELEPGSGITSDYVLSGSIIAFYADIRAKTAPAAVLGLRVFLTKNVDGTNQLVWNKTYEIKEPMKNTQAESFVEAISRCTKTVLQQLQDDLREQKI
jgi:ABC-type uncharacterized transport system auxiliary subunit